MAFRVKEKDPVDRAVADLEAQIAAVQRQVRELEAAKHDTATPRRGPSMASAVKEMLTPPQKKITPTRARRDLFDVPTEPLKELEAEPIAFAKKPQPDLFIPATLPPTAPVDCSSKPEEKLVHYLSAGSIKSYKPLKHVQRQTRNRFFMWLGLSFLALWFIYAVIR